MSLREWLIFVGILVIVVVMVDGYRRMRLAKKRASELSFGLEEVKGYDDDFSSELPNGGARVRPSNESSTRKDLPKERIEPDFFCVGSDPESLSREPLPARHWQASSNRTNDVDVEEDKTRQSEIEDDRPQNQHDKVAVNTTSFPPRTSDRSVTPCDADTSRTLADDQSDQTEAVRAPMQKREISGRPSPNNTVPAADVTPEKLKDRPPASEVIVINILARSGEFFAGDQLMQAMLACDLRYGDMSIFHRYTNVDGTGKILFSVANGVKPGTFSIDELESTQTPALSMFMVLPGPEKPMQAFALMVETARCLSLDLGGEMKDEQFSVMTQQTLEHYRQRIREYERKQLARQPVH